MSSQPFTFYVIHSAHTDIGYTHPQEQIMDMYLDHYDRVLELCRQHEGDPEAHRFKWTCETFWQVQHYLRQRPEREAEFLDYVRKGMIEITATYLHFTDLIDADAYRRSIALAVDYCRKHNVPLRTAMHCDINGWPWAMADILAEFDIPYFCSQVHIDSATDPLGKRGSVHYMWLLETPFTRPDADIRVPQAFWWQGPAGKRVLHWLNEHYLLGNVLGFSSPQGFHANKTRYFYDTDKLTAADLYAVAQREVPRYVERTKAAGYPHPILMMSTGGYYVDNSRPDDRWCAVIERWNAEHSDIKMRTATLSEWFAALEQQGAAWPTHAVAWPDHWAHGLGSMLARIGQARRVQRKRLRTSPVVAQSGSSTAERYLNMALEQERFALEHTFDAWSTSGFPEFPSNDFQQSVKELTFHRAELYMDEAAAAALRALPATGDGRVYAYSDHSEAHAATFHFDAGDQPYDPKTNTLHALDGAAFAVQLDNPRLRQFVATPTLPGKALTSFAMARRETGSTDASRPQVATAANQGWIVKVNPQTGALSSLVQRSTGTEWVDAAAPYGFGQVVQEVVVHPLNRHAVGNVARAVALGFASDTARSIFTEGKVFERTVVQFEPGVQAISGPVFDALALEGQAPHIGRVRVEWRLYSAIPVVELVLDWYKEWNTLPEAAYVTFPFAIGGAEAALAFETGGGFFTPGSHEAGGQLPGTCSTYYTIQRAARITRPGNAPLYWLPVDAPLVITNALDYNRWETEPYAWNGFVASMPVNHYWHTNFPTSQRGYVRLRYRLVSDEGFATDEAAIRAALPVEALGWR